MAELAEVDLPYPHLDAQNLFVRDDKRLNYYLITVRGKSGLTSRTSAGSTAPVR
ncbi:MAG: hypothetical protein V8Q30_07805 [Acutalibacteraceae bacterium]